MFYIGVDLGKSGAIVTLDKTGRILEKQKTPLIKSAKSRDEYDIPAIANIFRANSDRLVVFLEKGQPMPMSGTVAQFHRGFSFGLYQGILVGLGISYEAVPARTWQKVMLAGIAHEDTKQASIIAANRLWPKEDWRRSERAKNSDDGMTDAALIGEWGRRSRNI